jgi:riboflavin kinase/FMN adenylyltransferase
MAAEQVHGRAGLRPEHGPLFLVVGVFDGLHRGHAYLLEHLRFEGRAHGARPAVVTFDAHPDAVLTGHAPPLLMDADERLERLADAGVEVVVIEHFDDELRRTEYDAFVDGIASRTPVSGFLMTPESAFGHERRGTPEALAALGERIGFEVVVVPPFALDGREVRSSEIRAAITTGDLVAAHRLLGRPYGVTGTPERDGSLAFPMPVALPPAGTYRVTVEAAADRVDGGPLATAEVSSDGVRLTGSQPGERLRVVFVEAAAG